MDAAQQISITPDPQGALLAVCVKPRARADEVVGARGAALLISVTAPPADGKANAAVIDVLATALRRPKNTLAIARGLKARQKLVRLSGLSVEDTRARLAPLI